MFNPSLNWHYDEVDNTRVKKIIVQQKQPISWLNGPSPNTSMISMRSVATASTRSAWSRAVTYDSVTMLNTTAQEWVTKACGLASHSHPTIVIVTSNWTGFGTWKKRPYKPAKSSRCVHPTPRKSEFACGAREMLPTDPVHAIPEAYQHMSSALGSW